MSGRSNLGCGIGAGAGCGCGGWIGAVGVGKASGRLTNWKM